MARDSTSGRIRFPLSGRLVCYSVILSIVKMGVQQNGYQRFKECDEITKTADFGVKKLPNGNLLNCPNFTLPENLALNSVVSRKLGHGIRVPK